MISKPSTTAHNVERASSRTALLALLSATLSFALSQSWVKLSALGWQPASLQPKWLDSLLLNMTALAAILTIAYGVYCVVFEKREREPLLLRSTLLLLSIGYLGVCASFVFTPFEYSPPWLVFAAVSAGASIAAMFAANVIPHARGRGMITALMALSLILGLTTLSLTLVTSSIAWSRPVVFLTRLSAFSEAVFLVVPLVIALRIWLSRHAPNESRNTFRRLFLLSALSLGIFYFVGIRSNSAQLSSLLYVGFRLAQLPTLAPHACVILLALAIGANLSLLYTNRTHRAEACASLCWLIAGFSPQNVPNSLLALCATALVAGGAMRKLA